MKKKLNIEFKSHIVFEDVVEITLSERDIASIKKAIGILQQHYEPEDCEQIVYALDEYRDEAGDASITREGYIYITIYNEGGDYYVTEGFQL